VLERVNNKSPFAASSWSHTYLLINDARSLEHKEGLKKEYTTRLTMIQKSELNGKNKSRATAALAIPVLRYSSGIR